jgi:hypothetical protein
VESGGPRAILMRKLEFCNCQTKDSLEEHVLLLRYF